MSDIQDSMADELRASAERFVTDKTDHARTRALRRTPLGNDAQLWNEIVELGWLGILVPEEDGGLGLGLPEMAAIVGSAEKGLLGASLIELAVLGARLAALAPASELRSTLLSGALDGSTRLALATGVNDTLPELTVSNGALSGRCERVPGGAAASHFVVPIRLDGAMALLVIDAGAPGTSPENRWQTDGSPLGALVLDKVAISDSAVLARGDAAECTLARALDETRIIAAAALVGLTEHMLEMTIEYLKVRKQFDKPIGSFQTLQHKAVDLYIQKELAAAVLNEALTADGADAEALSLAALRAKGRASATAMRVGRESIQLHGAIGFTEEHDLGLYVKRAMMLSAWLGNATAQRRRFIEKGLVFA